MKRLTARQAVVLRHIVGQMAVRRLPPTWRELCALLGFTSSSAAHDHLRALERKGYLEIADGKARGIRLTSKALSWVRGDAP